MPDPLERFLAHPATVVTDVVGQPRRTAPRNAPLLALADSHTHPVGIRVDRRLAAEFRRQLDQCLVDEHGHRVEIRGDRSQPKPLRFERYGAAARKGIVNRTDLIVEIAQHFRRVGGRSFAACTRHRASNFVSRFRQSFPICGLTFVGILPLDKLPDDFVQPLALGTLGRLRRKFVGTIDRVVHHAGKNDSATSR